METGADAGAAAAGPIGMGGGTASTKPEDMKIDLHILSGMDKGTVLSLMFETEEQFLSWLITLRCGARARAFSSSTPATGARLQIIGNARI